MVLPWNQSGALVCKPHGEDFQMTESKVVNEWMSQGEAKGRLENQRQNVLKLLEKQFPGSVPDNGTRLINEQKSLELLEHWFDVAAGAYTFEQFLDVVKR